MTTTEKEVTEVLIREAEVETTEGDRRCSARSAMNAEKNARYHSNQLPVNLYIAVTVSEANPTVMKTTIEIIEVKEGIISEGTITQTTGPTDLARNFSQELKIIRQS